MGAMDALFGPDVIHFIKKIQRNQKCKNVCDCNVTMYARMVEWLKTRRLSRRSSGSAGSNPASRIFFIINNNFSGLLLTLKRI